MTTIRQQRVAELLFEELSIMIASELNDPRLSLVQVTSVDVSRDLRNVKVYVSHDDDEVSSNMHCPICGGRLRCVARCAPCRSLPFTMTTRRSARRAWMRCCGRLPRRAPQTSRAIQIRRPLRPLRPLRPRRPNHALRLS